MFNKYLAFLFKPINATLISVYRIIFGLFMIYEMVFYYQVDFTFQFMSGPQVLFPYEGLHFLKPLPIAYLKIIHVGLLASAVLITLGLFYRFAITFFFLGFTYFTFIDNTLYNNHLYLIAMIAFFMIFIRADKKYSLRSYFSKNNKKELVPAWNQYLLIFLISLPYFFGGIAKLSSHWLDTDLSKIIIEDSKNKFIFTILSEKIAPYFLSYGGLIYDLIIVFLLLYKRTRWLGVLLVLLFNTINGTYLFGDIGLFPWFMICSTILFFNAEKFGNFFDTLFLKKHIVQEDENNLTINNYTFINKFTAIFILFFVILQILLPFRYHLFTKNPEWTGIASKFSWRMKMQSKGITKFDMRMIDRDRGDTLNVKGRTFLSANQYSHIAENPKNFIHLAKYLEKVVEKKYKVKNPIFNADVLVSFNGRKPQYMFSPHLDLLDEKAVSGNSWILPLKN